MRSSYDRGSISVEFHEDINRTSFPAVLKQQVIRKAIDYGGANWSVYGINDQNFSNYIGGATYRNGNIILSGYNYDILYGFCEDLVERLSANPRVTDLSIEGPESYYYSSSEGSREYLITYDYDNLALYGISPVSAFSALSERLFSQYVGSTPGDYGTRMDVRLISDDTENFDVWHLANEYIRIDSTDIRFAEIGSIDSRNSGNNIFRQDQEYILCVRYNFIGSYKLEERLMESEIERLNSSVLPIGFKASPDRLQGLLPPVRLDAEGQEPVDTARADSGDHLHDMRRALRVPAAAAGHHLAHTRLVHRHLPGLPPH